MELKKPFKLTTDHLEGIPVISIQGDLTAEHQQELVSLFKETISEHRAYIFNFEHTDYINSAGISALIVIITDAIERDYRIFFTAMSNQLQRVVDMVGLDDFVTFADSNQIAYSVWKKINKN